MQADALRFDGDAALALQIHRVEHLFMHFALRERAGHLQQPVGERGLAMIDVRDDTKIAYELRVHSGLLPPVAFCQLGCRRRATTPGQGSHTSLETMPCNHSVCHKSQRGAARSPGYSWRAARASSYPFSGSLRNLRGTFFARYSAVLHTASSYCGSFARLRLPVYS